MRYELDNEGYIKIVAWGCNTGNSEEYTGEVPIGYTSLIEWSENALINAYYINEEGNLTLDSERQEELELRIAQETAENTPVLQKDFAVTNEVVEKQYVSKTANGSLLVLDNVKKLDPYVKITDIECYKDNKIDIYTQTKNMLKNDAKTETIEGQRFTKNADDSIRINKLTAEAEGTNIKIDDSAEEPIIKLEVDGSSTQNGTPTPTTLVEIKSVGDNGTLVINQTTENNSESNSYVMPLSQPLRSLPNGVKDTIEEDGIHRRVGSVVFKGSEAFYASGTHTIKCLLNSLGITNIYGYSATDVSNALCDYFIADTPSNLYQGRTSVGFAIDSSAFYFSNNDISLENFKTWLSTHNIEVLYKLKEEVIEPFDEEQQAVINSIETNAGTTHFTCDANMRITYVKGHSGIDYNLSGSSTNTTPIFVLKKGINYFLNIGGFDCEMKYFDGETTSQVYIGASGLINLSEDKKVTQVILKIPKGTSVEKTIKPQLELGSSASEFVCCETNRLSINLTEYISEEVLFPSNDLFPSDDLFPKGTTISYILIQSGAIYVSANNKLYCYGNGNVRLFNGYNLLYTLQDANIDIEYFTSVLKVEEDIEILSSKIEQTAEDITLEVSKTYATKGELDTAKSEIKVTTDNISSTVSKKVGNDEIISKINQSAEEITIDARKLNINGTVSANGNFKIETDGSMECTGGNVGGWTINGSGLTNGTVFVNSDGSSTIYTVADLIIMRGYIMGTEGFDLPEAMIRHYDLNGDGQVTPADYVRLQNLIGISMN